MNYTVGDGLPQSQIYAIREDRQGYLWFGTYGGGISRFDGLNFTNYSEEDGLSSNFVQCITQDKKDDLWIGTDDGLCLFDGQKFSPFTADNFPRHVVIKSLMTDQNKDTWIGKSDMGGKPREYWNGVGVVSRIKRKDIRFKLKWFQKR